MSYYEIPSDLSGKSSGLGSPELSFLKLRPDIVVRKQTHKQEVFYILKDPANQAYYKFTATEWDIISLFDGTRNEDEMVDEYNRLHPTDIIDETTIESFKQSLDEMEVLEVPIAKKNLMLMEKIRAQRKERAAGKSKWSNLMEITFSAWDPDRGLERIVQKIRFLWTKQFLIVSVVLIACMLAINFVKWEEFKEGTIKLYTFTDKSLWEILVFLFLMTATGTIHEFGHGLTLKHFGGEVHQMGFLLFYLSPAFYVDVSDSYILPRKERLWVTMAGTYTELILCSLASFVWFFAVPGTLIYDLSFQVVLFTGISSFFINMNPLIKLDGYYALMDTVEIPDLREDSFAYLSRWFKRNIFQMKVEEPEDLTRRKRRIFIAYGITATLYTGLVYLLIAFWLRNIYLETFHTYAYLLLAVTLYFLFRKELRSFWGFSKFAYLDKREVLMKRTNLRWIVPALVLLALILFVPRTHIKISSPFVVQPIQRADVRAEVDGFVGQVLVNENDIVKSGQVLAKMNNWDLEGNAIKLQSEIELKDRELARSQSDLNTAEYQIKLRERQQQSQEETELEVKLGKLTIRSPIQGKVTTPFVKEKTGTYLNRGDAFCEIANLSQVKVEIPIREYYVHDVKTGQVVEVKLDAYPAETFEGRVEEITSAVTERVEAVEGTYTLFRVTAIFDNPNGRMIPGMKGDAKILAERYSIGGRIGRELWRWIKSKIW